MSPDFIREHIRDLDPYKPIIPLTVLSEQMDQPIENLAKLDANENPYGMPPGALKRLAELRYGHIYPDPESRQIRQKLSDFLQVPYKNILVGAGADELIDLIARLTMNPGDKVIDCPPTFGFYVAIAQINNLSYIPINRHKDFSINLDEIKSEVNKGAKLIFLANPNNPDGSLVPETTLKMLLDLPILVVIDEAYIEFAPSKSSFIQETLKRDNLIVLRTFSKWGGLAGLRLGYGVFPEPIAQQIFKIKQPYNVSEAASEAGLGALEDLDILNQRLGWIIAERERLFNALLEFDWLSLYPTHANFILCRVIDRDAQKLKIDLASKGILIRYFNKPGLEDHVRFSIGKREQTDRLIFALKELER